MGDPLRNNPDFPASWGMSLKIVTPLVSAVLVGTMISLGGAPLAPEWREVLRGLLAGVFLGAAFCAVRGYRVGGGVLEILRPGWRTRIPLAGLRSVETGAGVMSASIRLFGNGGFWSFTGWFWNRRLGRYRAFVNDPRRAVALRFVRGCVVVSPDDAGAFALRVRVESGLEPRPSV